MEKETLEEAAKEFFRKFKHTHIPDSYYLALVEFAKLQQENSYSEEEVLKIFYDWDKFDYHQESFSGKDDLTFKQWFEKFKKK